MKRLISPTSAFPALASIAAVFVFAVLFLHAESQEGVLGLTLGAVAVLVLLARLGWNARAAVSFAANGSWVQAAVLTGMVVRICA